MDKADAPRKGRMKRTAERLRDTASDAGNASLDAIGNNPAVAIAVAAAAGAVAAGVIPTSRREVETLGPVAAKARRAAGALYATARSAGIAQLGEKGLTSAAIASGVAAVVGAVLKAGDARPDDAAAQVKDAPPRTAPDQPA